jgi:hypothetical protein
VGGVESALKEALAAAEAGGGRLDGKADMGRLAPPMARRSTGGFVDCALSGSSVRGRRRPGMGDRVFALVGKAEAMASLMRRTETPTSAPILRSLRRMVAQLALANCVRLRPMRRKAQMRT